MARYDGPNHWYDIAYASALSPDGTALAVTGQSDPTKSSPSADYATVLYATATGQQRWVASYDGPANGWDAPADIAWSPDGTTLYVTGRCRGKGSKRDFATIAYEAATAKQLWVAQYDDLEAFWVTRRSRSLSLPTAAPSLCVAESRVFPDWWQHRRESRRLRHRRLRRGDGRAAVGAAGSIPPGWCGTTLGRARSLLPTVERCSVVGWGWGGVRRLGSPKPLPYDTQSGRVKWVRLIRGTTVSAAVSPDGGTVFVAGTQRHPPHTGPFVVALDVRTGKPHWSAVAEMPGGAVGAVAWDVALSPDGTSLYATGSGVWSREGCYTGKTSRRSHTTPRRVMSSGERATTALAKVSTRPKPSRRAPMPRRCTCRGRASGFGGDRACVVGTPNTGFDFATVAYDAASGAQLWVRRYDSPGRAGIDSAHAMVVDGQGSIYVSGESTSDFLTLRYNP